MESVIRLNSQTTGRDKVFRLCQYTCRFLWSMFENASNREIITKLKDLETLLANARRLLRFGRGVETLYSSFNSISIPDPVVRTSVTLSKIATSLYLLTDHVVWLQRTGLVSANKSNWSELSNRFWLYSIMMNLVRDGYEILEILKQEKRLPFLGVRPQGKFGHSLPPELRFILHFIQVHKNVSIDTLKNVCDVWIPLNALHQVNVPPTLLGFIGVVSSVASILQILDYTYRLSPS